MTTKTKKNLSAVVIDTLIHTVRSERIILDSDLATIYSVPTKRFNEAVRRNLDRFPEDFRFQLSKNEWLALESLRSQNATLNKSRGKHRKYLPYAFTEHGAIMAANILNSPHVV